MTERDKRQIISEQKRLERCRDSIDSKMDRKRERCQTDSVLVIKERVDVRPSVVRRSKICKRKNKGRDGEQERERGQCTCVWACVCPCDCVCESLCADKPRGNLLYLLTWRRVNKADCSQHGTRAGAGLYSHRRTQT